MVSDCGCSVADKPDDLGSPGVRSSSVIPILASPPIDSTSLVAASHRRKPRREGTCLGPTSSAPRGVV